MPDWRLIDTGFLNGYENMALDEALLLNFTEGASPVLRLYGWEPAAVSVGRFQKPIDFLNIDRCNELSLPIVRRITGGGMIYHHLELTYSIICSPEHLGTGRKPTDAYRKICGFLLEFYRRMGLDADFALNLEQGKLGGRENFCFAGNEQYDIIIGGKKIGGNAQKWLKHAVFQHGSIPVENCIERASKLLLDKPENLLESSTSLHELEVNESYSEMFAIMRNSFFAKTVDSELTVNEKNSMQELLETKYSKDSWNNS
ncbi:MAG: lipoate--protein ligase family protein [Denitrovibrio sp.]|nr:MAG: lipoate--protein ligase family protein [Denitrovibrio sp.]